MLECLDDAALRRWCGAGLAPWRWVDLHHQQKGGGYLTAGGQAVLRPGDRVHFDGGEHQARH